MQGVSCWNISVGASLSRSTPWTWSTGGSGSLRTQRKKKYEHEYPAVSMFSTFHWRVNRKRVWGIFIWRGLTWPHTCMPTLALLSAVNILLQSDRQIFAFSSLQLNLEPSYLMAIMSPAVYYLIIWPIYFWPPYSAAHINGSSCGWPDVGLTSVWHCNTSCKTWCANAQWVQEAAIPESCVNFMFVSWLLEGKRRNGTGLAIPQALLRVFDKERLPMSELMIKQPRRGNYCHLQSEEGGVFYWPRRI